MQLQNMLPPGQCSFPFETVTEDNAAFQESATEPLPSPSGSHRTDSSVDTTDSQSTTISQSTANTQSTDEAVDIDLASFDCEGVRDVIRPSRDSGLEDWVKYEQERERTLVHFRAAGDSLTEMIEEGTLSDHAIYMILVSMRQFCTFTVKDQPEPTSDSADPAWSTELAQQTCTTANAQAPQKSAPLEGYQALQNTTKTFLQHQISSHKPWQDSEGVVHFGVSFTAEELVHVRTQWRPMISGLIAKLYNTDQPTMARYANTAPEPGLPATGEMTEKTPAVSMDIYIATL